MAARNRVFDWIVVIISFLSMWFISFILFDCNDKWCCCCYDGFFCSAFFFIHGTWPCCIYGHWTENQSVDTDEENWIRWKWSISTINETRANVLSLVKFLQFVIKSSFSQSIVAKKKQFAQTAMDFLRAPLICFSLFCAASQSRRISIISAIKS